VMKSVPFHFPGNSSANLVVQNSVSLSFLEERLECGQNLKWRQNLMKSVHTFAIPMSSGKRNKTS
jgi:hypothetical protein